MDSLLFHPKIVHFPIALAALMPAISLGLLLAWWRGWLPARVWWIAVLLQAVLVGSGWLALRTGEDEEETVERVVSGRLVHEHEEAAEAFMTGGWVVLAATFLAGLTAKKKWGLPLAAVATLLACGQLVLGVRAGEKGGDLVYRHGAASAYVGKAPAEVPVEGPDDD